MLTEKKIYFNIPVEYIKKEKLFNILITQYSYKDLSKYVGVRSSAFMKKFNITNEELLSLAKSGLIKVSYETLYLYTPNLEFDAPNNRWNKYKLYDVYDYFKLKQKDIDKKLGR